jgi:4-alpha-glucanotransferase
LRAALDQFGPGQTHDGESAGRDWERGLLWRAISDCGAATSERPDTEGDAAAVDAAVAFVARSASQLALFPVEDLVGSREQVNLPGTTDQHPNWRRRLDADARRLLDPAPARARLAEIRRGRGVDR